MTTVSQLVERTRRLLQGQLREEINTLNTALDDSTTTLTTEVLGINDQAPPGSIVEVDEEVMYVSAGLSSLSLTVIRGYMGTTAASHSSGAVIRINPRFPTVTVKEAMLDEIRSWSTDLYQVDTQAITLASSTRGYNLGVESANLIAVLEVLRDKSITGVTDDSRWARVDGWRVARGVPVSEFDSGVALFIDEINLDSISDTIQVVYAKPFDLDPFELSTDLQATVGLEDSFLDIVSYGAAWRVMAMDEVARTSLRERGASARNEEHPPGHRVSTSRALKGIRDERLTDETIRLRTRYPVLMS